MRSIRLLAACVAVVAVAGCASAKPGWTYAPAPSAPPVASGEPSASSSGAPSAPASTQPSPDSSASAPPPASAEGGGAVLEVSAEAVAFDTAELAAPADQPFQIHFTNNDASILHNVAIHEGSPTGPEVFKGEIFAGPGERTYDVPALPAASYGFVCTVHPNMVGTLTAG